MVDYYIHFYFVSLPTSEMIKLSIPIIIVSVKMEHPLNIIPRKWNI
jgi:hypothetical protein